MPKREYFRYKKTIVRTAGTYDTVESNKVPDDYEAHISAFTVENETSDGNTVRVMVENAGLRYPVYTMLALLTGNPRRYTGHEVVLSGSEIMQVRVYGGVAGDIINVSFEGYMWKDK